MKSMSFGGMMAGMALGAATVAAFNMMSRQNKRKLHRFAVVSGRKLSDKANDLFGK